MKKIIALLILIMLACPAMTYARSAEGDLQLMQLKNEKKAKDTVINTQIKVIKIQIAKVTIDESMPANVKNAKLNEYQNKILNLENQKSAINLQYKKAKKAIN
jgi:hypothetical protein